MKFKPCLTVVFLLLMVGSAFGVDLKNGFLGKRWGADVSELPGLFKVRENGNIAFYVEPGQAHVINNTPVSQVVYGFYEDRLFAVYVRIDSDEQFNDVKNYMALKYGDPSTTFSMKSGQKTYRWKYQKIKMKLKYSEKKDEMKLALYYTPLSNMVNEERQERFYDRSLRFFPIDRDRKPETLPSIPLLQF